MSPAPPKLRIKERRSRAGVEMGSDTGSVFMTRRRMREGWQLRASFSMICSKVETYSKFEMLHNVV